ncbi:Erythroid differentiation-related factor 1, partial [Eschrichtius robustus]|nr:Erythroid differentiation-related factor 1 [Eschrichtius robustus]
TGDWTWLKEFYQRLIDQKWQRKKKSKEHWYQKAILSKFLYYRDNNKPINVLTGIDYWLDNLICNVPELVMCFHVNGIVQIIASANYMLSELFQLDEPKKEESSESPLNENSDESYSEEEEEMPDSDENGSYSTCSDPSDDNKAVAIIKSVGELSVPEKYKSIHQIRPSCAFPVCHDTEERCRLVLSYVLEGLKSVDSSIKKESDLPAADPNTPIPLKYEDESTRGGPEGLEKQMALFLDKMGSLQKGNYSSQSGMIPGSWQHKMKLQLILKSSKAYYVLSDAAMSLQKYGRALRYIKLALQSHDTYCCLCTNMLSEVLLFLSQYLTLCGDIQLMLAQNANNRAAHLEEFNYQTKEDQEILHSLHRESSCQGFAWATDLSTDLESQLSVSCKCYEAANEILQFSDLKSQNPEQYIQVLKRMGNIRNEIGVFYMNQAAALQSERVVSKTVSTAEQQLWKKSFSCFEKGIHNFESIADATNAALLLCNTGRLMRICAQAHCGAGDAFKREFSPEEGLYYNKVGDEHLRKQHRLLADLHYSKAVKLFQLLRDAPCELLRVQLERVAFAEFQMTSQNSNIGKLKTLSGALDTMVRTKHAFQLIRKELVEEFDQ